MERRTIIKVLEIIGCVIGAMFSVYIFICNINYYVPEIFEGTVFMYIFAYGFLIGPTLLMTAIWSIKEIIEDWWL